MSTDKSKLQHKKYSTPQANPNKDKNQPGKNPEKKNKGLEMDDEKYPHKNNMKNKGNGSKEQKNC
jgi:hypothetical protein